MSSSSTIDDRRLFTARLDTDDFCARNCAKIFSSTTQLTIVYLPNMIHTIWQIVGGILLLNVPHEPRTPVEIKNDHYNSESLSEKWPAPFSSER